jgi:1-acyl-sn-glycerol-3-phosphate acyltransferase
MTAKTTGSATGLFGAIYGIYAWIAFVVCVVFSILVALFVPGLERRRRWVAAISRTPFILAGIHTTVRGLEKLPAGSCIVVANHASYVDGVLVQAYLPPRFSYVIKGEMGQVPFVGFLLGRIGSKFVERFDTSGSARDARQLLKAASAGESLGFFPEGTFVEEPGLGPFRPGAFAAAIRAGVPVVPVAISGTRHVLPADRFLPRHGHFEIEILNPIDHGDPAYGDSKELAAAARASILGVLDEPDLVAGSATARSERPGTTN